MAISGFDNGSNSNVTVGGASGSTQAQPQAQTQTQGTSPKAAVSTNSAIIGFDNPELGLLSMNMSSEQCNRIASVIKEEIEKRAATSSVRVDILDKEIVTNLSYSSIILSNRISNGDINYYPILIPGTGRECFTAAGIVNEYSNVQARQQMGQRVNVNVFTYDQAFDSIYDDAIQALLATVYKTDANVKMYAIDGMVLPYNIEEHELVPVASAAAVSGYNALRVDALLQTGKQDLNLQVAKSRVPNGRFNISKGFSKTKSVNALNQPVRADWELVLELQNNTQVMNSLNNNVAVQHLVGVKGYIDALPGHIQVPGQIGAQPVNQVRLHPHVVIDAVNIRPSNQTPPTTGYLLTGILAAIPMLYSSMWAAPLIRNIDNVVHLNKIVNLFNDPSGVGVAPTITKKTTEAEIKKFVFDAFSLHPVLSIDIDSYGPQSYYTAILAAAANPENAQLRLEASKHLIATAHQLTNGIFPADYNPEMIFQNTGVKIPTGTWASNKGEHDIREIDLAFVCAKTQDPTSALRWANSNYTKAQSGTDPFGLKIEGIAELVPDAVISGSAVRVTFRPEFIDTLASAARACGLELSYEPEVSVDTGLINWSGMASFAGINPANTGGLAREFIGNTPTQIYSPYTTMGGFGRF